VSTLPLTLGTRSSFALDGELHRARRHVQFIEEAGHDAVFPWLSSADRRCQVSTFVVLKAAGRGSVRR